MGRHRKSKKYPKRYCLTEYLLCTGFNSQGQGIVNYKNKLFYIDFLIPGELARIMIFYEYETEGYGRAIEIKNPSNSRQLDVNHPKLELGIYHIAHLTNQAQDEFKQHQVNRLFGSKTLPMIVKSRIYYRNKVVLSDGGFKPPGKRRKYSIIPTSEQFDLMKIDFKKYQNTKGDLIIRRLDTEIVGKPGENKSTQDHFLNKIFNVNLNSFYQVNSEMARLAYQSIIDNVEIDTIVFDLFAGAATIGICVADKAKMVYAVEINEQSYADALINIQLNKTKNLIMIKSDANNWIQHNQITPDIIILDPARSGLSQKACEVINASNAKKIIYLSCNIATQKRDIDLLINYHIVLIQPYDFFPQTYHIENLIILERNNY